MIQRLPFRHAQTAADVARLRNLLRTSLAAAGFPGHRENLSVLNLACGRADETGAIAAAVAPGKIGFYFGLDLRADAIAEATARWALPAGTIDFRCGDGSAIHQMRQLPAFDLIFIRHQNYWHDPARWDVMCGHALAALAPGGLLACTSYFDFEHELLKASLATRGARVLWDVRSPGSRALDDASNKSVDRRLALFGSAESLVFNALGE